MYVIISERTLLIVHFRYRHIVVLHAGVGEEVFTTSHAGTAQSPASTCPPTQRIYSTRHSQESPRQTKPKKGQFMNFAQGHSGTKAQCESCLFSQGKTPEFTKMGEIHELFVLPLSLVWFAGATPDILKPSTKHPLLHSLLLISLSQGGSSTQTFFVQSFSTTLRVMDVRAENCERPHQKVRFPAAPVVGRNFWTPGHSGVRGQECPRRNRKPEPSEPFFPEPKPKAEPEPPEPFSRNRNRNRNRSFLLNCTETPKIPF